MIPVKVLHVAPTPFFSDRGCHIRIRGIVRALNESGVENLVCTYPIGRDTEGVATRRCPKIPGYNKTEAGPSAYKYVADLLLVFTVAKAIRQFRPDLLHCHLHEGVLIGWLSRALALRWTIPMVFDMQGSLVGELEAHAYFVARPLRRKLFCAIEERLVKLADVVVASSQASIDFVSQSFALSKEVLFLVGDGADVATDRTNIRDSVTNKEVAIYSGGLSGAKGLNELQELMAESSRRGLPVDFRIIGFPVEPLVNFVEDESLQDTVTIIGRVDFDDLGQHLAEATIAIEPKPGGTGEASGKLINYMAAGLPVVCFDTANNRYILDNNGFFAKESRNTGLVDTLQIALQSGQDRRRFARLNIERVREQFSWQRAAIKLREIYAILLGSGFDSTNSSQH